MRTAPSNDGTSGSIQVRFAADVDAGQRRPTLDRIKLAIGALPRLAITFVGFLFLLFVGVFLPIVLIRILGYFIALVVVFAIGRVPISIVSPSPSDLVSATVLTVWAGLWTGLAAIAYAKVYLAQRSRADSPQSTTRPSANDGWDLGRR
jgi:hypothetical protein